MQLVYSFSRLKAQGGFTVKSASWAATASATPPEIVRAPFAGCRSQYVSRKRRSTNYLFHLTKRIRVLCQCCYYHGMGPGDRYSNSDLNSLASYLQSLALQTTNTSPKGFLPLR